MAYTKIHNDQVIIMQDERDFNQDPIEILDYYTDHFHINKGDVVVDMGAWPGEFSIYAARQGADVIAIELFEDHFQHIKENFELNNLEVETLHTALWHQEENLDAHHDGFKGGAGGIQNGTSGEKEEITGITFDSLLESLIDDNPNRNSIDFIKMDIEGSEMNALLGLEKTIERFHPEFAIADYHSQNGVQTVYAVEGFLNRKGYTFYTDFPHQTTVAYYEEE